MFSTQRQRTRTGWVTVAWHSGSKRRGDRREIGANGKRKKELGVSALDGLGSFKTRLR